MMYVLPDPVGACTTTSFPCCNARTASCCHRSGITNPAPNPGVILGRCLQCGLLAIRIEIWRRTALVLSVFGCPSVLLLGPVLIYYVLMRLRLVVEHDSETKRWAAFFPELPGCASAGDTEDEAIQNAKEALELWFEPAPVDLPVGAKGLEVALT